MAITVRSLGSLKLTRGIYHSLPRQMSLLQDLEAYMAADQEASNGPIAGPSKPRSPVNSRLPSPSKQQRSSPTTFRFLSTSATAEKGPRRSAKPSLDFEVPASSILRTILSMQDVKSQAQPMPLPDLSSYKLSALQYELTSWGYKSSPNRDLVLERLEGVWNALWESERQTTAKTKSKGKVKASSSSEAVTTAEAAVASLAQEYELSPEEEQELEAALYSSEEGEDEAAAGLTLPPPGGQRLIGPSLSSLLISSIRSESQFYHRILLMEPIPFEEVWSLVLRDVLPLVDPGGSRGITGRLRLEVREWLDLRGICFYEGDPAAPRARHG